MSKEPRLYCLCSNFCEQRESKSREKIRFPKDLSMSGMDSNMFNKMSCSLLERFSKGLWEISKARL